MSLIFKHQIDIMKSLKGKMGVYSIWKCPYISHVLFLDVCRCGMIIKVKLIELLKLWTLLSLFLHCSFVFLILPFHWYRPIYLFQPSWFYFKCVVRDKHVYPVTFVCIVLTIWYAIGNKHYGKIWRPKHFGTAFVHLTCVKISFFTEFMFL